MAGLGFDTALSTLGNVTIADGESLSDAIDLKMHQIVAIDLPSNFTGSGITFQVSMDSAGTFLNYYDNAGEVLVAATAGTRVVLDPSRHVGLGRYLKVRANAAATPQEQSADISLQIIVRILR